MYQYTNQHQIDQPRQELQLFQSYSQVHCLFHPEAQRIIGLLLTQNGWLINEIKSIKENLNSLNTQIKDRLTELTQTALQMERLVMAQKSRKKYRKQIDCPYKNCGHRYSSKIALNCHIRTKHCHVKKQQ